MNRNKIIHSVSQPATRLTRRGWMAGAVLATLSGGLLESQLLGAEPQGSIDEALANIQSRAKKAGLKRFESQRSPEERFVGIGDAPATFRGRAIEICEALAKVYLEYFEAKGFEVQYPRIPLILVILKDQDSYQAYAGGAPGASVGGHYDVESNELVIFDFRDTDLNLAVKAERVNTFTLVHESLHQLTYNSGLLSRKGDVPVAISEGLATFGENWQASNRRSTLGAKNSGRLGVFRQPNLRADWIKVEDVLAGDDRFDPEKNDEDQVQLAYAVSWLLVHYLIRTPARLPKFQAYLKAIQARTDPSHRLEDAQSHLGDLARLDQDVRKYKIRQR